VRLKELVAISSRSLVLSFLLGVLAAGCGRNQPPQLIIVGLDAFNWRVLGPLIRDGRMPELSRVVNTGWWDVLLPEEGPIISPRLWTSIATGRTVQGHGIYDWQVYDKVHGRRGAGPADRTCAAFWNVLSDHGLSVGVLDWMATWPPEEIRGYMISKLFYPPGGNTFPADLEERLWNLRGDFDYEQLIPNDRGDEWARLRNGILLDAVTYLTRRHPVDVLAVMNYTPDPVQHKFWKYYEPSAFPHEAWWTASGHAGPPKGGGAEATEAAWAGSAATSPDVRSVGTDALRGVLERHYVWSDTLLAACLSLAGPKTVVAIVSDHGQEPCGDPLIRATKEGVNRVLAQLGYARVDSGGRAIRRESIAWAEGVIGGRVGMVVNPTIMNADGYVDLIREALGALRITETATPLFSFVGPCTEVGYNRLRNWAVDLCAVPAVEPEDYLRDRTILVSNRAFPVRDLVKLTTDNSGCHTSEGILVLAGPYVQARGLFEKQPPVTGDTPKQVDVLPTVLYLLGFPLSRELEGRVLWEALESGMEERRPPSYVERYEFTPPALSEETPDSKDITDKGLRALGYVQ
jgi:hypothetical protein